MAIQLFSASVHSAPLRFIFLFLLSFYVSSLRFYFALKKQKTAARLANLR